MEKSSKPNTKFISLFKGLMFAYIVTALILLLLSFLLLKFNIPSGVISVAIVFTYIISNFLGGFIVGKVVDAKKYIWGLFLGIFYFIIIMIISIALNHNTSLPFMNMIIVFAICSLSGMVGGMLS